MEESIWRMTNQNAKVARFFADRHYSRATPGAAGMMPPGRQCVLVTYTHDALWGASWPKPELVNRAFPDSWVCTIFRNESATLSSDLIRQAIGVMKFKWGSPPADGCITFVNPDKVRRKRDPGRCFLRAGFVNAGETKNGLIILRLDKDSMPDALKPTTRLLVDFSLPYWTEGWNDMPLFESRS